MMHNSYANASICTPISQRHLQTIATEHIQPSLTTHLQQTRTAIAAHLQPSSTTDIRHQILAIPTPNICENRPVCRQTVHELQHTRPRRVPRLAEMAGNGVVHPMNIGQLQIGRTRRCCVLDGGQVCRLFGRVT